MDHREGLGGYARFRLPCFPSPDGRGAVYCRGGADADQVARMQLPASWRAVAAGEAASPSGSPSGSPSADEADERARVTTLPFRAPSYVAGLAYHPSAGPDGALIIATRTALYRLPLNADGSPAAAAPLLLAGAEPVRPPCGSLHADMGALLDRQPDGTADLTLVVGDRRFPVHRAILGARSPYFRQRLEGGFADGAAAELSLPDADPDAFALVLRWLYTGAVDIPSALAPAVAELADRLLLPELCSDAQAVVLSGVSAETVVGCLLWAEGLGGSFAPLLSQLKAWCAEHGEEVVATAPESLEQLSARNPKLAAGLMADLLGRSPKQRRTG
ncbi:hypothetical protein HYH03_001902 [Edaphochlamys debaryana]|uniref:BTB domain-containing protein n=1 Tax=Edaphochlamys debaryana TaxID=47281 RepID=A0A835YCY8_9CHLO|nr:hypothetical protein HYH03_001902 [Edaphochlamys debaryana]|eukprot:KAG2500326.1 hypothetical protein HYH03_001902 [Edaphochlamys debaryana]